MEMNFRLDLRLRDPRDIEQFKNLAEACKDAGGKLKDEYGRCSRVVKVGTIFECDCCDYENGCICTLGGENGKKH